MHSYAHWLFILNLELFFSDESCSCAIILIITVSDTPLFLFLPQVSQRITDAFLLTGTAIQFSIVGNIQAPGEKAPLSPEQVQTENSYVCSVICVFRMDALTLEVRMMMILNYNLSIPSSPLQKTLSV